MTWMVLTGLVGVIGLAVGGWLFFKTSGFVARAASTTGRYVDATMRSSSGGTEQTKYAVIEFQPGNGPAVRFQGRLGTPFEAAKIGQPVAVLYNPSDPQDAVINSFIELWMPTVIFSGVGAGWLLATLIVWLIKR